MLFIGPFPDYVATGECLRDTVVVPEIATQWSKIVSGIIDGRIQAVVPAHESYLMLFQSSDQVLDLIWPCEVEWRGEGNPARSSQSQRKAQKLIAEKVVVRLRALIQPLRLQVECWIKERRAASRQI